MCDEKDKPSILTSSLSTSGWRGSNRKECYKFVKNNKGLDDQEKHQDVILAKKCDAFGVGLNGNLLFLFENKACVT